ncbi:MULTISPECIES: substrate-binding periplasmic protein [unclassified Mesorhizobium]|uniref:substrate-binding periplasmic protein n=1 Tax=unclassified Mesorhizobium TaxID=325217 RepID=UPI001CCFCE9D|nr:MULTISPECIES: transporter substrate-binding domain-containing protein [unclassified Mesorhizobium]MBZ9736003.1 transporter substrate-binding domain-containing protein [Mesorhizobium sp. CA9]MBZ9826675.1 transporter substrate-binding domain-containing protein [Mesorhizobium sp. CA18]MBZ9830902.1 transporter substrate-binding domain-containing protein [Mesorhizobium sp. CA2]MBZ9835422.1 transporter substrate-binding domain-containing protein [Mesorhizobium sp. CA3]MBZ9865217.1 transporter sub
MPLTRRTLFAAGGGGLLLAQAQALATPAQAQDAPKPIVSDNKLRIAMPAFASDPFFPADGSGESGIDMDLARGIAAELGVEPVFDRSAGTFDAMVQQLTSGQADLAIGKLSRTLRRGRSILYSRPYAMLHQGLLANRVNLARITQGKPAEQIIRDFSGDLGVIEGSSFATYAAATFPHATIQRFAGWNTVIDAIRNGTIDLAYRDDFEIKKLMVDDPSMTVVARSITLTDKVDTIAVGISPANPHLAAFVDLYLDLARGQQVLNTDEIIARYRQGSKA